MEADKKRPRHEVIERYHKLRAMAEQKEEPHLAAKSKRLMEKMRVDYQLTDAEINPHQKQYQFDINNLSKEEKELLLKGAAVLFATGLMMALDMLFGTKATITPPKVKPMKGTKFYTEKK